MRNGIRAKTAFLFFLVASFIFFAGVPPQAAAQTLLDQDLTLKETTTSPGMMGQGPKTMTSTSYLSRNAVRRTGSEGSDSIIRFDQGKVVIIDNLKKTYSEFTAEQLQQMIEKTAGMTANKEQIEMMRKMMGQLVDTITCTKEGPGETIAGYATVKYRMTGMVDMEIWAAPDLKMPGLYYDALKMQMPANPFIDTRKIYDEFKKIDGIMLKTVMTMKIMNNEMKSTTVVTSVEKTPIPASVFEVPAGYKQVPFSLGK